MSAEVHTLTGAYVCDALNVAEREAFEAHMDQCPECAAEVVELREVTALMAIAAAAPPPAALKGAVDARIRITRQQPPVVPEPPDAPAAAGIPGQRNGMKRIRAGWAVAAALALVVGGLGWRTIDQQHQIDALTGTSTQVSQLLSAPDASATRVQVSGGGSALLVDSRDRNEAAVVFTGLAQAPAGKTYQLWLMAPDGSARSVGLMEAAPGAPILVTGLTGESQVGMTVEPAGGSARPTSAPVMVAALGT